MWTLPDDDTRPIITAREHISSAHATENLAALPPTCVLFEMGRGLKFLDQHYETVTYANSLPCFLDNPKCLGLKHVPDICFTKGGYGASASVDTLETLIALGVNRVISVGLCGGFSSDIQVGDVVIPSSVLSEEGTSRHYVNDIDFAYPDPDLHRSAVCYFKNRFSLHTQSTVTSDAVYRQTFAKEA